MMSAVMMSEACRKVFLKARECLDQKMEPAITSMIRYSKHNETDSLNELGFGSCLLLALIHSLSNCDLMLSAVLLELSSSYRPLKSSHFTAWLIEDYSIDVGVIQKALEQLIRIGRSGLFCVPEHMRKLFMDLARKSGIHIDTFINEDLGTGPQGNTEANRITTEVNAEANRITADENAQEEHVTDSAVNEGACSSNACADRVTNTQSPVAININTLLINAVIVDNSSSLEDLSSRGADLSMTVDGQSLLHLAVKKDRINAAKALVKLGARLNRRDSQRLTPLHIAVEADNVQMVQFLIDAGADTSCKLFHGETLLMFALSKNSFSAASECLKHGFHVNDKNDNQDTALHIVLKGYESTEQSLDLKQINLISSKICNMIKFIVDNEGDLNIKNSAGETALHIAARICDRAVIQSLLGSGAAADLGNNEGDTPMHIAASSNNHTSLEKLAGSCSTVNITNKLGKSPLHLAVSCGSVDCVDVLLESGANLDISDNSGYTPLCTAAEIGNINIIEILSKEHVKINHTIKDSKKTPLHLAAEKGHVEVVKVLLERGADHKAKASGCISNCGPFTELTPLHFAASGGHLAIVQELVQRGADLEAKDNGGYTPLHWAAREGHLIIVQGLVERGADFEAKHTAGYTPLHWAASEGHLAVVQELLERGADLETKATTTGYTPLHVAASGGQLAIVQELVERGAGLKAKDNGGNTPLHCAACKGHLTIVQELVERGADLEGKDNWGNTPLHQAAREGHLIIVQELVERGADFMAKTYRGHNPLDLATRKFNLAVKSFLVSKMS